MDVERDEPDDAGFRSNGDLDRRSLDREDVIIRNRRESVVQYCRLKRHSVSNGETSWWRHRAGNIETSSERLTHHRGTDNVCRQLKGKRI
jgi:hypothetical protein